MSRIPDLLEASSGRASRSAARAARPGRVFILRKELLRPGPRRLQAAARAMLLSRPGRWRAVARASGSGGRGFPPAAGQARGLGTLDSRVESEFFNASGAS